MIASTARTRLACLVLLAPFACAGPPPPSAEFEAAPKEGIYIIGTGDHLRVDVWQNPQLSAADLPVRPDGKITIP